MPQESGEGVGAGAAPLSHLFCRAFQWQLNLGQVLSENHMPHVLGGGIPPPTSHLFCRAFQWQLLGQELSENHMPQVFEGFGDGAGAAVSTQEPGPCIGPTHWQGWPVFPT